jgi:hypothetical protein
VTTASRPEVPQARVAPRDLPAGAALGNGGIAARPACVLSMRPHDVDTANPLDTCLLINGSAKKFSWAQCAALCVFHCTFGFRDGFLSFATTTGTESVAEACKAFARRLGASIPAEPRGTLHKPVVRARSNRPHCR